MRGLFVALLLACIAASEASAAEGNCGPVGELSPPSHQYCIEVQTEGDPRGHIPPVPKGYVQIQNPPCWDQNPLVKNGNFNKANCRAFCVTIPTDARDVVAYGWMTPLPWRPVGVRCELGNPDCNASFGSFEALAQRNEATGNVLCTVAKNWSDTDQRQAGFRVEWDR